MKENAVSYLQMMRVKHYIKNFLIFVPVVFSGGFFDKSRMLRTIIGFFAFCMISSAVYIQNDIRDIEKDRMHPKKSSRPLASGRIKKKHAVILMFGLIMFSIAVSILYGGVYSSFFIVLYLVLNIAYSHGLKDKPIIDVVILASGFAIRVFYGGFLTKIVISNWLYLVVIASALYFSLGKRRNELRYYKGTREVLDSYNIAFLDKNMYLCVALANTFYALWAKDMENGKMIWTVPVIIIIFMCYSLDVESDTDGDPVEVVLSDKKLIALIIVYVMAVFSILYLI